MYTKNDGADSHYLQAALKRVDKIYSIVGAFAALLKDVTVVIGVTRTSVGT